jgi:hypothetical protein
MNSEYRSVFELTASNMYPQIEFKMYDLKMRKTAAVRPRTHNFPIQSCTTFCICLTLFGPG